MVRVDNEALKSSINKIGTGLVVAGFIATVFSDEIAIFLTMSVLTFGAFIVMISVLEFKGK